MPSSSRAWSLNVTDPDVPSPPGSGRIPVVLAKAYNLLPEMPPLASESSVTVFFRLGHAECSASLFPPSLSSPVTQRLTDHVTCRRACSCSGLRRPPPHLQPPVWAQHVDRDVSKGWTALLAETTQPSSHCASSFTGGSA